MNSIEDTQPGKKAARQTGMGRPPDYWLLWLVVLGSLALNIWLINTLLNVRRQVAQAVADAAVGVGQIKLGTVDYTVHVDDSIPVSSTIPISDTLIVPVRQTIAVNSTVIVKVPILGDQALPFSTRIPVNFDVSVPISETFPLSLTVPIKLEIPVSIALDETPLGGLKADAKSYLENLAEEIGATGGLPAAPNPTGTTKPE